MALKEMRLRFGQTDRDVDTAELGDFLFLFRATYAGALSAFQGWSQGDVMGSQIRAEAQLRTYLRGLNMQRVNSLFSRRLGARPLMIRRVTMESPLQVVLSGAGAALVGAVILSGGKFKGWGFEVELPPIGDGIRKLRDALSPSPTATICYSVKAIRVKLSGQEYDELMKYDPQTRHRGGFQRFLIGLQFRVNRRTHELDLSDSDVGKILRHGGKPKRDPVGQLTFHPGEGRGRGP